MKVTFDKASLDITPSGKVYLATLGDKTISVEVLQAENGRLDLLIDGKHVIAYISSDAAKRWVTVNGRTIVLTKSSGAKRSGGGQDHSSELAAPMPGVVRSVNIEDGESVAKGQTLMVLEAMKMEIRIQAPFDGAVKSLMVKVGQTVERDQILVKIDNG